MVCLQYFLVAMICYVGAIVLQLGLVDHFEALWTSKGK